MHYQVATLSTSEAKTALESAFINLDLALSQHQLLWQEQPFVAEELAWFQSYPDLKEQLLALSDQEAHTLHHHPQARQAWFQNQMPELFNALYAYQPEPVAQHRPLHIGRFDHVGIPGRKWKQVLAFAHALDEFDTPIIDWCSGKGHLSRIVQTNLKQPVHCLEWDKDLVEQGQELVRQANLDVHYYHHDVLQALPEPLAQSEYAHIALHACGDLHLQLLHHVANSKASALALSPCCYQKTRHRIYQPLSAIAKDSQLVLDKAALQLAVQETVTARHGEQQQREQAQQWRLAFDALQREVRGSDTYLSIPSIRSSMLRTGFDAFCQWAASEKQLSLPDNIDYAHYLHQGEKRYREVFRLELLRQLFNRPLELWLVLDRALYLEEQGYQVSLNSFCENTISPRNLLIRGRRS